MLRLATLDDVPALSRLALAMSDNSSFAVLGFCPERFAAFVAPLITHGFALVSDIDGEVVGAMLGDVVQPWFAKNRMGVEYAVYLAPEHRSGLTAARMVSRWERWCKEQGAVQCRPSISTGNTQISRLYEAMGFETVGAAYSKTF